MTAPAGEPTIGPGPAPRRRESSAAFFDRAAERYAARYEAQSADGHALRARRQRVLELLAGAPPGGRVLDVGCGPGLLASAVVERGHEFWGMDAAPAMIEGCRERHQGDRRVRFLLGDAARLPFAAELFDTVICTGVIDRLPSQEAAVREMVRVLRSGGTLLVSFPNLRSPYAAWKKFVFYPALVGLRSVLERLTGRSGPPLMDPWSARLRSERGAAALLAWCGMEVTGTTYYHFDVLLSPLDEVFPRWAMRATERLEGLRSGRLKWLGAGFILEARKRA